jgi:tetratricopeptide (TPR) repeat protein
MKKGHFAFPATALLASLLLCSPLLRAQDSELAETHFKAASSYYNQGKYEKALEEFKEAYRLMPLPEVTYNMAQCYERLGQLDQAITSYEKYIEEKPDAKDLQAVKEKIASLRERLEKTGLLVAVSEDGAKVFVDDQDIGTSPIDGLIKVPPGSHELRIEKEGFQKFTMKFSVAAGLSQSTTVTLTPETGEKEGTKEGKGTGKTEPVTPGTGKKGSMAGYYAGYGVSAAVLIGGVVTGVLALVNVNNANDNVDNLPVNDDYSQKAKKLALATDVLLPAGAVGIVVTTIVLGVKKPWKEKPKEEKKGGVSLLPALSGDFGGIVLKASF